MRSRPESCGKDSHETPCFIDGECLCCFSAEWLLCAAVEPVWVWMRRRLCSNRRLRSWRMSSGRWIQPGSRHDSNRFSSTGTSRHFTIHTAAGGVSADDAADDRDGLAADLSLRNLAINANRRPLHSETNKAAGRYVISCRLLCCAGGWEFEFAKAIHEKSTAVSCSCLCRHSFSTRFVLKEMDSPQKYL